MFRTLIGALVCAALLAGAARLEADPATVDRMAEPNPPVARRDVPESPAAALIQSYMAASPAPSVEWTYHKTPDNQHPDGNEQLMVWLMNRARSNPTQEGTWLAWLGSGGNSLITDACNYPPNWVVDMGVLQSAFAAIPARPPAAFDVRLYYAAKNHSDYLISIDDQVHDGQLQRVTDQGFDWQYWAGIVFSYSKNTLYGHAGFNIDWGQGPYGMQDPPGHRKAIMSVIDNTPGSIYYSNVGYAVVPETNSNTSVGPQVITGNLVYADTSSPDHYNRFIVGTVWEDTNGNSQYDPGEGLGGVTVMPDSGTYYAVTGNSGGYAIPVAAGTYGVTFAGGELAGSFARTVTVGSSSVLQDLEYYSALTTPSPDPGSGSSGGGGGGGGCFLVTAAGTDAMGSAGLLVMGVVAALGAACRHGRDRCRNVSLN